MRNIVQIFEQQATDSGYKFLYGAREFLNYDLSNESLSHFNFIMAMFPMTERSVSVVNFHRVSKFQADVTLWFGRKFDPDTGISELDETNYQKYNRRLMACKDEVESFIKQLFCSQDFELVSVRLGEQLNEFAENLDFISCEMTFNYDNT